MMKGYEEGAIDYLFKPLDPEIARAKVSALLRTQLQKKELLEKNLSLEKSALLINNSADIIGILDAATLTIEEINDAFYAILGYTHEDTNETSLYAFLSDEDKEMMKSFADDPKERLSFETHFYCKDRSMKWLQWNVVVKYGKWFVNARDITGIKEAAQQINQLNADLQHSVVQLEATNKELESFSYSISHDLRTPLRAINGYSRIIEEDYPEILDGELKRLFGNIRENVLKMATLIDDLLAFSKLGRQPVKKSEVNMKELVDYVIEEIGHSPHHARIENQINHSSLADYNLIKQVWLNFISNAVKYSAKSPDPHVEIGSSLSGNEATYYIKDNGAGFDMKYADKLFGVFQRLHAQDEFEGTGVGLAIVHRVITKHGGRIWADAAVGKGATFYFTLPA